MSEDEPRRGPNGAGTRPHEEVEVRMSDIVRPGGDATTIENAFRRHLENPFLVLGLGPDAGAAEVERQGQKWLGMLAAGLGEARVYVTPFGTVERTAELVRAAMAELVDPAKRLVHEWWAQGFAGTSAAPPARAAATPTPLPTSPPPAGARAP